MMIGRVENAKSGRLPHRGTGHEGFVKVCWDLHFVVCEVLNEGSPRLQCLCEWLKDLAQLQCDA